METITVKIEFLEEVLGLSSANREIYSEFTGKNSPDAKSREEEIAAIGADEFMGKVRTIFPKINGKPVVWDYQIKGMFKDFCRMLSRAKGTRSSNITAFVKVIDGLIFVAPRAITLEIPKGEELGECQRPLRVQGPKGERVALAASETCPVGTTMIFRIDWYELKKSKDSLRETIIEWLDYGVLRGFSQWRNSGKGRFRWEEIVEKETETRRLDAKRNREESK